MKLPNFLRLDPQTTARTRLVAFTVFVIGMYQLYVLKDSSLAPHIIGFAFFACLAAVTEMLPVDLPKAGVVSVSFATNLACLLVYGPWVGSLAAVCGIVGGDIPKRNPSMERVVFNAGQIALSAGFAGMAFRLTGGDISRGLLVTNLIGVALATIAYFVTNATVVTWIISVQDSSSFPRVWARNLKWSIPNYMALAPLGLLVAVIYLRMGIPGTLLLFIPLLLARYSFQQYVRVNQANRGVIQALAAALEAKDSYTKGHSDRVAQYAELIMRRMGLTEQTIDVVKYAAEMHDIGKIGVSEALLNKPGQLTADELEKIREHASIGANILGGIQFLQEVSNNIKYHHEWYDGVGGYPKELSGEAIPLGARILMVCDSFDAMTTNRPYRKCIPVEEAIRRLRQGAGTQFDPAIVEIFTSAVGEESLDISAN